MAAENRFVVFVLISFNGIEGILKDILIKNLRVIATSYKQKTTNRHFQVCLLTLHDHKQQLTFLQRFKLIGLYPA